MFVNFCQYFLAYATVCQRLSVFASVVCRFLLLFLVLASVFQCLSVPVFFSACLFQCFSVLVCFSVCLCVCVRVFSAFQCFSMLLCCCLPLFVRVCRCLVGASTRVPPPPPPPLFVVFIRSKTNGAFNDLMYYFGPFFSLFFFCTAKEKRTRKHARFASPRGSQAL